MDDIEADNAAADKKAKKGYEEVESNDSLEKKDNETLLKDWFDFNLKEKTVKTAVFFQSLLICLDSVLYF